MASVKNLKKDLNNVIGEIIQNINLWELENSDKFDKPIVTAISEAPEFYIAEEYHQDFYKKQSMRYQMYANASGRKGYLEDTWGNS